MRRRRGGAASCALHGALLVHQSADLYGSDRVLLDAACALRAAGGHAIVAVPEHGPLVDELRRRGIETSVLPGRLLKLQRASLTPRGLLALLVGFRKAMAALDYGVAGRPVHLVQSNTLAVLAGVAWARLRAVPHRLWHVHEIVERPLFMAHAFAWLLRLAGGQVVCNSQATSQWLVQAQPRLARRLRAALNGVPDTRPLSAAQALCAAGWRQAFRPAPGHLAIGLVGRINPHEGPLVVARCGRVAAAPGPHSIQPGLCGQRASRTAAVAAGPAAAHCGVAVGRSCAKPGFCARHGSGVRSAGHRVRALRRTRVLRPGGCRGHVRRPARGGCRKWRPARDRAARPHRPVAYTGTPRRWPLPCACCWSTRHRCRRWALPGGCAMSSTFATA